MQGEDQGIRGLTGSFGERVVTGALCLMVAAVPLVMMTGIFEYSVLPKRLTLHVCLALACLGWIIQTRWGRHIHLVSGRLLLPAVCFMGVALVSSHKGIHSLDTQTELVNQAALVILFLIGANAVSFERFRPVLWTNAITGLLVAMIGILQYHGFAFLDIPSNAQPSATFGNRNFAAEYLVCAGPLSILLFLQGRSRTGLFFSGLSAALMGVYLAYTRTRGAWLGIAVAIALVGAAVIFFPELRRTILGSIRSRMDRRKLMMAGAFVVVFIFLSVLPARRSITDLQGKALPFLTESRSDLATTATSFFKKDVGVEYRLAAWKGTLRMVADFPFIGVGPGDWVRVYPAYDRGATTHPGTFMNRPHNDYLLIASEYGLVGLSVFIWLIAAGFWGLVKMGRSPDLEVRIAAPMLAISLVSFLVVAVFAFPKEHPQTVMFFYMLLGSRGRGGSGVPGVAWTRLGVDSGHLPFAHCLASLRNLATADRVRTALLPGSVLGGGREGLGNGPFRTGKFVQIRNLSLGRAGVKGRGFKKPATPIRGRGRLPASPEPHAERLVRPRGSEFGLYPTGALSGCPYPLPEGTLSLPKCDGGSETVGCDLLSCE